MFYVYLLKNSVGRSYVGFTSKEPRERLKEHNNGSNSFTKGLGPWKLHYFESFTCENCARKRELFLKSGIGNKLVKLIINGFN